MRADRLLLLLLHLQARGKSTASELADRLEVSVRTIYRDLNALSSAGVPVYARTGPGGGIALLEGYRTPLTGLKPEEASALLTLGVPGPFREIGLGEILNEAHLKVLAALPSGLRNEAVADSRKFHLDFPSWFKATEDVPTLPTLSVALRAERRVKFRYEAIRGRKGTRRADPLGLVNKAGSWYLVASTTKGIAVFRVGRISSAELLDQKFDRPSGFDLRTFWDRWISEFESTRPRVSVRVRISPHLWPALPEIFGEVVKKQMDAAEDPDAEGWRTTTLTFESEEAASFRLIGFGSELEIVSPEAIRSAVIGKAEKVLSFYGSRLTLDRRADKRMLR